MIHLSDFEIWVCNKYPARTFDIYLDLNVHQIQSHPISE